MVRVLGYKLKPTYSRLAPLEATLEKLCTSETCFLAGTVEYLPLTELEPSPQGFVQSRIAGTSFVLEYRGMSWNRLREALKTLVPLVLRNSTVRVRQRTIEYVSALSEIDSPVRYDSHERRIIVTGGRLEMAVMAESGGGALSCTPERCTVYTPASTKVRLPIVGVMNPYSDNVWYNAMVRSALISRPVTLISHALPGRVFWPVLPLDVHIPSLRDYVPRYDTFMLGSRVYRKGTVELALLYTFRNGRITYILEKLPFRVSELIKKYRDGTVILPAYAIGIHDELAYYYYHGVYRRMRVKVLTRFPVPAVIGDSDGSSVVFEFDPLKDRPSLLVEKIRAVEDSMQHGSHAEHALIRAFASSLILLRNVLRVNRAILPFTVVVPVRLGDGARGEYYAIASPRGIRVVPRSPWVWPGVFVSLDLLHKYHPPLVQRLYARLFGRDMDLAISVAYSWLPSRTFWKKLEFDLKLFSSTLKRMGYRLLDSRKDEINVDELFEAVSSWEDALYGFVSFWPLYLFLRYRERGRVPWTIRNATAAVIRGIHVIEKNEVDLYLPRSGVASILNAVRIGLTAYGVSLGGLDVTHPVNRTVLEELIGRRIKLPQGVEGWYEASKRLARILPLDLDMPPGSISNRHSVREMEYE